MNAEPIVIGSTTPLYEAANKCGLIMTRCDRQVTYSLHDVNGAELFRGEETDAWAFLHQSGRIKIVPLWTGEL